MCKNFMRSRTFSLRYSHATERSSIFSKSKLILSPVAHINFPLRKTSKNVGINIKKLLAVLKNSVAYKGYYTYDVHI